MKDAKEFCTCTDYKCPNHPVNHDKGCTFCIQKNLRQKEIPACFFHDIDCEKPTPEWHYRDFAILVEKAGREGYLKNEPYVSEGVWEKIEVETMNVVLVKGEKWQ